MLKYLFPRIALRDLQSIFKVALVGAVLAAAYGILHDNITFAIGPEYFTNLKFDQFRYADIGLGDRIFVSTIGVLATWWVGFIAGWFLARRLLPNQPRQNAMRQVRKGFAIVFACGLMAGGLGYLYGVWRGPDADYSAWSGVANRLDISDIWPFVRVAYIHNASYIGGVIGLLLALILIKPLTRTAT